MTTEQMDAVDASRTFPGAARVGQGGIVAGGRRVPPISGYAQGGWVNPSGPGWVPERHRRDSQQQVHIDYSEFVRDYSANERRAFVLDLLDKIDEIDISLPGVRSWEEKQRPASEVLDEVKKIVKEAIK